MIITNEFSNLVKINLKIFIINKKFSHMAKISYSYNSKNNIKLIKF